MKIVEIQFNKPTHWSENKAWINLNEWLGLKAKKIKANIVVKLPEGYCKPKSPAELLKNGIKTEAVFLRPDEPMKLIGDYFQLYEKDKQEEIRYNTYFWESL